MSVSAGMTNVDREFLKNYNADEYEHPSVTADILICTADISGNLEILLIKRKRPPYQDCWAIPGGFLDTRTDASLDETAARELKEETNIEGIHMEQLYTFSAIDRDPRTRVISTAYLALVPRGSVNAVAGDDAAETGWYKVSLEDGILSFDKPITLAFDHEEIIKCAIERMRGKISYTPIAFNFLNNPQRFSIYELQKIYEAVLGNKLDAANFRRSFLMNYVKKGHVQETGEECKEYSHRASKYYRCCSPSDVITNNG